MSRTARQAQTASVAPDILAPRALLLLSVLALTLIGFVMIYSASSISAISEDANPASYLVDQLVFAVVGIALAFVLWKFVPYRWWTGVALWAVWGIAVVLILLTALTGLTALGAQRWVVIGPFSLQPSEFAKIPLVLMAARWLYALRTGEADVRQCVTMIVVFVGIPTGFIFVAQSDLGTTMVIFMGILAVLWLGEVPVRTIAMLIAAALVFVVLASVFSSYRSDRWVYLNPWNDGQDGYGAGYQIIHSFYAFAEGGIFGAGLGNSREKFLYLPESETDFIFAIIGEELGLVGALVVIGLFLALLWSGLRIARSAPDAFGTMVAGSLVIMLVFQAFLNIGCVIGILPTTGKPLPFISSGGSSLIASYLMVGIVLSVSQETGARTVHERRRDDLRVIRSA